MGGYRYRQVGRYGCGKVSKFQLISLFSMKEEARRVAVGWWHEENEDLE